MPEKREERRRNIGDFYQIRRANEVEADHARRSLEEMQDGICLIEETQEVTELTSEAIAEQTTGPEIDGAEIFLDGLESVDWTQFDQETEDLRRAKYAQDHADIVPVETEEEQRHRQAFLEKNRLTKVKKTHQLAQKPILDESKIKIYSCGKMDVSCEFCGAIHFKGEMASGKKFNLCCSKEKVILPPPKECTELLQMLFTNCHPKSASFIKDARKYTGSIH